MSPIRSVRLPTLAALLVAPGAFAADVDAGKVVFQNLCATCHSTEAGTTMPGPTLAGVIGRKAATVKGFAMYTDALKKYDVTWDEKTLDEFLASPTTRVPGTMMIMPVPDAEDRADLIAYLKTLKAK